jgi:hypothetical protein
MQSVGSVGHDGGVQHISSQLDTEEDDELEEVNELGSMFTNHINTHIYSS